MLLEMCGRYPRGEEERNGRRDRALPKTFSLSTASLCGKGVGCISGLYQAIWNDMEPEIDLAFFDIIRDFNIILFF
jgi:hypothetical protein